MSEPHETLALLDYRRATSDLYSRVRQDPADEDSWKNWRYGRDDLFATHSQSALNVKNLEDFAGLPFFNYEPAWRIHAKVEPVAQQELSIVHSDREFTPVRRFAQAKFEVQGEELSLALYWLDSYGGGIFLPFRDGTSGKETYGGGRYLLDTAKGADLGHEGDLILLDFNYAYHPSCVHSDRWSCPLAPPENHLDLRITAGERL